MKLLSVLIVLLTCLIQHAVATEKKMTPKKTEIATDKTQIKDHMNEVQAFKYGEVVKFEEGQSLQFPDFKLVYVNEEDPEANSEIKSTADVHIRHFLVTDKNGEQKLDIVHGQLPPQDAKLKLTSGNYVIYTFKSPKGDQLFPHSLVIVKK